MGRNEQLIRQWNLLRTLSARRFGATIRELAQEFETSEKTISRDLAVLRQVGVPITETSGDYNRKTYRIDSSWGETELTFPYDEALALYLARHTLQPIAGTYFWSSLQRAFQKIRSTLREDALEYILKMAETFYHRIPGASDYKGKGELLDELYRAIEEHRQTIAVYHSASSTEPVEYELYPYGVAYHRGSLYLIAFSLKHDEIRHFKVDRFHDVEVGGATFEFPKDFDLTAHCDRCFGIYQGDKEWTVRIKFSSSVARYVRESKFHPSQQLELQKDGGLIATFTVGALDEILRWVMSFGTAAEVLEPPELITKTVSELRATLDRYETENALS
ncbi:HTH domain protein [Planctomycetes bacterium Pan216]|uniref:HTH domain protein n=1 Tax=Kolteria novifilia TaxID=2527975 RepID=A0A518B0E0_9BACT|nr:HTH domain protein [Planctomycetes bacterium Pan216]